jgi:uncharacterized membrane protein YvbJ
MSSIDKGKGKPRDTAQEVPTLDMTKIQAGVFLTIRRIIRNLRVDDSIPTIIHLAELINKTALSEAQIKRLINELHNWGLITKETNKLRKGSSWESEMKISIGGKIKNSVKDIVTDHKRPGGDQRCHKCGSKNIEPSVYLCKDCGHYGHYD